MTDRYQVPQGASEWGPTGRRRPNESLPSVDELRQALRYDPATGQFWWTRKVAINTPAGSPAGYVKEGRYVVIRFRGAHLAGHRVAWAMHYGEWPPHNVDVDHINQVKHDNRIENLRLVTRRINVLNAKVRSNSRSGVSGVRWHKATGKWAAAMCIHGQYAHIGLYPTIEEAAAAKEKAERDILGHSQDDAHSLLRTRLAAVEAERDALRELVSAIMDNRGKCFIPTLGTDTPDGLLNWDERARAALAAIDDAMKQEAGDGN